MQVLLAAALPRRKKPGLSIYSVLGVHFPPARNVQFAKALAEPGSKHRARLFAFFDHVEPGVRTAPFWFGQKDTQAVADPKVPQLACATELVLQGVPADKVNLIGSGGPSGPSSSADREQGPEYPHSPSRTRSGASGSLLAGTRRQPFQGMSCTDGHISDSGICRPSCTR